MDLVTGVKSLVTTFYICD